MHWLKWTALIFSITLLAVVGILFALHNSVLVSLDLLVIKIDNIALALCLALFFAAGGLLGILFSSGLLMKMSAENWRLKRNSSKMQSVTKSGL